MNNNKEKSVKWLSYGCILLAGCLWGSMGIFVRRFDAKGVVALDVVAIRAVVTSVLLLLFLLMYDREKLRIRVRDLWCFLGTGLCSIVFFNYCYFSTITRISLSMAAVLLYTAPAMVILMSRVLFREALSRRKVIALVMTFLGCICVSGVWKEKMNLDGLSILIGLGSGLGYALYSIFSRYAIERGYHAFTISFYTFLFAAVGLLPFTHIEKNIEVCTGDFSMLVFTICFGVVSTVLPYILYTYGLNKTENGKASILASVEPLVAALIGIVVFGETMTISGFLGMLFILGGIVICRK